MRNISRTRGDDPAELSAEQVAAYLAKYATKATESFGTRLDRRITADDLATLDAHLPAHAAALVRACWELAAGQGWMGCGCGGGRTCSASGATGRPRAAATPPP